MYTPEGHKVQVLLDGSPLGKFDAAVAQVSSASVRARAYAQAGDVMSLAPHPPALPPLILSSVSTKP